MGRSKDVLIYIDRRNCDFFQNISDKFQVIFGLNNFWLAKFFIKTKYILFVLVNIISFYNNNENGLVNAVVAIFFATVYLVKFCQKCEIMEKMYEKGYNLFNENLILCRLNRGLFFVLLVLFCGMGSALICLNGLTFFVCTHMLLAFCIVLIICAEYFYACTPRPKGKSKVKLLFQKIQKKIEKIISPEPVPDSC
ncbi:MAG: hypothetical protein CR972_01820 [Candidatus Moraniibacteriota bacterium]|nr:MAG: hypothetical protein CR972_01820 [Candidatus Moranbacteria bacterium]